MNMPDKMGIRLKTQGILQKTTAKNQKTGQKGENDMKVIEMKSSPEKPNPHNVSVRLLYDTEHAQAVHIELKPGETLKKHTTPVDVFFYILEGKGVVEIGDEQEEVSRDMLIESPAKVPHRLLNPGDGIFRVLVVKVPRQTEPTRLL
jgi:mannose-6-phosphate isomerase-like protein (cupin superfamily)